MILRNEEVAGPWGQMDSFYVVDMEVIKRACMVDIVALFLSDFGRPKVQPQIALRGANKRFNLL